MVLDVFLFRSYIPTFPWFYPTSFYAGYVYKDLSQHSIQHLSIHPTSFYAGYVYKDLSQHSFNIFLCWLRLQRPHVLSQHPSNIFRWLRLQRPQSTFIQHLSMKKTSNIHPTFARLTLDETLQWLNVQHLIQHSSEVM